MRKRTIKCAADTIFWSIVYMLPIIGYLIFIFSICGNPNAILESGEVPLSFINLGSFMSRAGVHTFGGNVIYTAINNLFGNFGVIGSFLSDGIISFVSYFVSVYIAHLVVDFLLFIPKLAMKWMNHFTNTED